MKVTSTNLKVTKFLPPSKAEGMDLLLADFMGSKEDVRVCRAICYHADATILQNPKCFLMVAKQSPTWTDHNLLKPLFLETLVVSLKNFVKQHS